MSEISTATLLTRLEADGVLLLQDPLLPSLVSLVAGGAVRGSWWGHPLGGLMYRLYNELAEHPELLMLKLVSGKVTFVHRRLWPSVVAVGAAREAWQLDGLSVLARELLAALDDADGFLPHEAQLAARSVKELELRLLVVAREVHTLSGAHAKDVQTWPFWAGEVGLPMDMPVADAKRELEGALDRLNARHGGKGRLPWR